MCRDVKTIGSERPPSANAGAVIGVVLIALAGAEVPKYLFILRGWQSGALVIEILCCQLVMAGLPYAFLAIAPNIARFEHRWLPVNRWHWLAFPILVMLMFSVYALHEWLMSFREDWSLVLVSRQLHRDMAPIAVVGVAAQAVLFAPIAEELFWRAFLLSQLGKLTRWPVAVTIQSLLFSLSHLPKGWSVLIACFFYGTILGIWWIRFRSILPLIIAHLVLNAFAFGPHLVSQYRESVYSYPQCREIDRLANQSPETAVPALVKFMADGSDAVSCRAIEVLGSNFRSEAEPYVAQVLKGNDERAIERALFAVDYLRYSSLLPLVRQLIWSSHEVEVQISALITLRVMGDLEGIRDIAQGHPEERVRCAANNTLKGWDLDQNR